MFREQNTKKKDLKISPKNDNKNSIVEDDISKDLFSDRHLDYR